MLKFKNYCSEDICNSLFELGYDFPRRLIPDYFGIQTEPMYDDKIHLYDAQQWIREKKNIEVNASFDKDSDGWIAFIQRLDYPDLIGTDFLSSVFNSYEEALLEGIKEVTIMLKKEVPNNI